MKFLVKFALAAVASAATAATIVDSDTTVAAEHVTQDSAAAARVLRGMDNAV